MCSRAPISCDTLRHHVVIFDTYLGVKLVKDVFQVVTLNRFLRVEKVEELLHELGSDVHFEALDFDGFVDDELQKELVDALQMGPGWVHLLFLVNTSLSEVKIAFLNIGQRSEDVLLNHLHHLVQVGNDHRNHIFLVGEHLLELLDRVKALSLEGRKVRI